MQNFYCENAAAICSKSRSLAFGWCLGVAGALPIVFIPPREADAFYIPMIGWTLYAAVVTAGIGNAVLRFAPAQLRRAAIVLVVLCLLLRAYRVQHFRMGGATILGQQTIRAVKADLDRQGVNLPHGATVISIGDPFAGTYDLLFLLRLYSRDPTLEVEHAEADDSSYGLVLKWSGAHLTDFTNRRR